MKQPNSLKTTVTTGIAGAAALAAGTEAYGAVVAGTLPANFVGVLSASSHIAPWDVDGDLTNDFALFWRQSTVTGNWISGIYGYGGVGVAAASAYIGTYGIAYVYRLGPGASIGPATTFNQVPTYVAVFASRFTGAFYGQFQAPNTRGFIGFEFTNGTGLHFGYLELQTSQFNSAGDPGGQTFFQVFWETDPNTKIVIPVPEPSSLAALAFGAAVLGGAALRRRKSAKA